MERREFLTLAGASALALATGGVNRALAADDKPAEANPVERKRALMKLGCQRWGSGRLSFLKRYGVTHVCASPAATGPDGLWTGETCRKAREFVEAEGMHVASMYLGVTLDVLMPARRDGAIDKICRNIRAAGEGGIPSLQYNLHHRVWDARTADVPGRGGVTYSAWKLADAKPAKKPSLAPITRDELWARITYFLEKVVPVAEEAKVKLALHPPDPPIPDAGLFGMVQVMNSVDEMKRFVQICDSDYHGLTFCQGTFCEMMENPQEEIYDVIRWFGERKKIHGVHFRNLRGKRDDFVEPFHDDGDIDMFRAIKVYRDVGYEGMLMPDHVPGHAEDPEGLQAFAFAYGYIRGLIQAADAAE